MMHKTNDKHFRVFKQEVLEWIIKLGLTEWRITILHQKNRAVSMARASFTCYPDDRIVTIFLEPNWGSQQPTMELVKRCAFHEVMHIVLATFCRTVQNEHTPQQAMEIQEHVIIHRFENMFYGRIE